MVEQKKSEEIADKSVVADSSTCYQSDENKTVSRVTENIDDPLIGIVLSERYRIEKLIGSGGCGNVYLAHHLTLNIPVAVKILHLLLARDPQRQKRLEREAKVLSSIQSTHVIRTLDYGLSPHPFLVMEYFEGISLAEVIAKGAMPLAEAYFLIDQICDGLLAAHQMGMAHRDLKPANILVHGVGKEMKAKILDFGLAKLIDESSDVGKVTGTGEILGSPAYMSPEQWTGRMVDERSDIYSLGCVIYEIVTGKSCFEASGSMQFLNKHLNESPLKFAQLAESQHLPKDLETVIFKCLQKNPVNRYENIADLRSDLNKLRAGSRIETAYRPILRFENNKINKRSVFISVFLILFTFTLLLIWQHKSIFETVAGMLNEQADKLKNAENYKDASNYYRLALIPGGIISTQSYQYLHAMRSLASCLEKTGVYSEAQSFNKQVKNLVGDVHTPSLSTNFSAALALRNEGKNLKEAETYAKRALISASVIGKNSLTYSSCLDLLGSIYRDEGNRLQAIPLQEESLRIVENLLEKDDPLIAERLNNLALVVRVNDLERAERALKQAILINERNEDGRSSLVSNYNNLATLYVYKKNYKLAEESSLKALQLNNEFKRDLGPTILNNLAAIYLKENKIENAIESLNEALKLAQKQGLSESPLMASQWNNLGQIYVLKKDFKKAEECFSKGLELLEKIKPLPPDFVVARERLERIRKKLKGE